MPLTQSFSMSIVVIDTGFTLGEIMSYFYIEHIPTGRKFSPNDDKSFRNGRNWRKTKATLIPDQGEAYDRLYRTLDAHQNGEKKLKIRDWYGYIRERDFRVVEA